MSENKLEGVVFKRTSKGKHNLVDSGNEQTNNDNSLDKAGMGDANLSNIEDTYKTMPVDINK